MAAKTAPHRVKSTRLFAIVLVAILPAYCIIEIVYDSRREVNAYLDESLASSALYSYVNLQQ